MPGTAVITIEVDVDLFRQLQEVALRSKVTVEDLIVEGFSRLREENGIPQADDLAQAREALLLFEEVKRRPAKGEGGWSPSADDQERGAGRSGLAPLGRRAVSHLTPAPRTGPVDNWGLPLGAEA